jgi:hypothetical protein
MSKDRTHWWWVVHLAGSDKLSYLIYAHSEKTIRTRLIGFEPIHRVHKAMGYQLLQVMSGIPSFIGRADNEAPGAFRMVNDDMITWVIVME